MGGAVEGGESWKIKKSGEEWTEEGEMIDVDRRMCVFSAAAGAAVCASVPGCRSNALIHSGVRRALLPTPCLHKFVFYLCPTKPALIEKSYYSITEQ